MPSTGMPSRYGEDWTREELVLAFDLYCRIPFAKTKANNPEVQELARLLDRSPGSVARKLGNLGSFDPALKKRNISGLKNTSQLDEQIWNEFQADWNGLVIEADRLRQERGATSGLARIKADDEFEIPAGPSERLALVKQRIHQAFFRSAVLSGYEQRCCITGIALPECLRASHIVPWSRDERYRADPTNGLCLSATFDRLFDSGLLTVDSDHRVVLALRVLKSADVVTREQLVRFHGQPLTLPKRFRPSADRLGWHRSNVFK